MKHISRTAILTCLCAFLPLTAFAQWPASAAENLLICDHTGEQALPKVAATSDSGCYIAWYDHSSGNYDVYLQRLNADGVPQWTNPCGMLISNHAQSTSLSDWDIAVDLEDHCIIVINDIRAGGDRDIYAYRISPVGVFVWGADGITLSDNTNDEAIPIVTITHGGNIAFAWVESITAGSVVHLRKLTTVGTDIYTAGTITLSGGFGVSIPRMAAAENDELLLQYLVSQGLDWWSSRHVYMQKYDSLGTELWLKDGAAIMTTDGIGVQMLPDLAYDGEGGAYSFWHDTRNSIHHVCVQHTNNTGAVQWIANGVQVDFSVNERQMSPSLTRVADGVVVAYLATNSSQSLGGIQAQKLNTSGELQWANEGVELVPLSNSPAFNLAVLKQSGYPTVFYSQFVPGSVINTFLRAIQFDYFDGSFVWDNSPRDLCSVDSEKGRPNICVNNRDQLIAVWPDSRIENNNIYLQNINFNGTLGSYTPPPPSLVITSPQDGDHRLRDTVTVDFEVEGFTVAPNSEGDGVVAVYVNGETMLRAESIAPFVLTLEEGESEIVLDLLDNALQRLNPPVSDTVHVAFAQPSFTIISPAQDTTVYTDGVGMVFEVGGFEPGVDGVIYITATQDTMPPISGFTTGFSYWMPLFMEGEWMIVADLRESPNGSAIQGAADTVYVTYVIPAPAITITYPEDGDWFLSADSIEIQFQVENFEIAAGTGDGWIHVYATIIPDWQQPEEFYTEYDHYSNTSITYRFEFPEAIGAHIISLTLVDNMGHPLEPLVSDTVRIDYGDIAADDRPSGIPDRFALHPAYPNPFNPETTIRYDVQKPSHIVLIVHDLLGRTVSTLVNDTRAAGSYSVVWNGRDNSGLGPSGVYFVRMNSASFTATQKLMLIR